MSDLKKDNNCKAPKTLYEINISRRTPIAFFDPSTRKWNWHIHYCCREDNHVCIADTKQIFIESE